MEMNSCHVFMFPFSLKKLIDSGKIYLKAQKLTY